MKLWTGRFQKELDQKTNDFNSSISFDSRMAREDILGSMAHAAMLAKQGIISAADGEAGHVHEHDHFQRIHPDTNWRSCLEHGEKLGLGTREYELIKI